MDLQLTMNGPHFEMKWRTFYEKFSIHLNEMQSPNELNRIN